MAIDLNADVGTIIKQMFNKKSSNSGSVNVTKKDFLNKYYKNAIIYCVLAVCFTLTAGWLLNYYTISSVEKDDSEFATNDQLEEALGKLKANLKQSKEIHTHNKSKTKQYLDEFSSETGSKNLFKIISTTAKANDLKVDRILQGKVLEYSKPINYKETTTFLEIEGFYSEYINFKRQLMENKPILTINKEIVEISEQSFGQNILKISLEISDYSLMKDKYEKLLDQKI